MGANRRQLFFSSLWEARHGIIAGGIAAYGRVMTEVGISMMVGGNIKWHTRTITTAIALETNKGQFGMGVALVLCSWRSPCVLTCPSHFCAEGPDIESAIFEVSTLKHSYAGKTVLEIEHLSIEPASIVGLIGPNGSGKSNPPRDLGLIERPTRGEVRFCGRPVEPFSEHAGSPSRWCPRSRF